MNNDTLAMKVWRIIYPPVIYLAISILVQVILTIIIVIIQFYQLKLGNGVQSIGRSVEFINNIEQILYQYAMIMTLISALITLFVFYIIFKNKLDSKLKIKVTKSYLYIAVLGLAANLGLSRLISLLPIDNIIGNYDEIEQVLFSGNLGIQVLAIVIVVPVLEEIIFRGIVYNRLKEYTNKILAAVITSIMFGVYHMNLVQGLYAFFIGLLLVFVYEKYNSIQAPILLHMVANGVSVFLTYIKISDIISKHMITYVVVMLIELFVAIIFIQIIHKRIV